MTTYESKIKTILHPQDKIYETLADLNNLVYLQDRLPQDKLKELTFDSESISAKVDMVGTIKLKIIHREPSKTIKFTVEGAPSEAFLWIQLKEVAPGDTKMKITLKAQLNTMLKMMLKGKIPEFLNRFADSLTMIDYSHR